MVPGISSGFLGCPAYSLGAIPTEPTLFVSSLALFDSRDRSFFVHPDLPLPARAPYQAQGNDGQQAVYLFLYSNTPAFFNNFKFSN